MLLLPKKAERELGPKRNCCIRTGAKEPSGFSGWGSSLSVLVCVVVCVCGVYVYV